MAKATFKAAKMAEEAGADAITVLTPMFIKPNEKELENFKVLSGSDYLIYGTLAYGGAGCVAGTANVAPRLVVDIYEKYMAGDYTGAMEAQYKLIPLRNTYNYGSFPVVMKDYLNLMK